MVVGYNNRVVGFTRFQNKEMTGLSFGTQKVVIVMRWSYSGVPLY